MIVSFYTLENRPQRSHIKYQNPRSICCQRTVSIHWSWFRATSSYALSGSSFLEGKCVCRVTQSCPTLCDPTNCSPPRSSVHGISQPRTLEWVAIPFSRRSSQPRDRTHVSCIAGRFFTIWAIREELLLYFRTMLSIFSIRTATLLFVCLFVFSPNWSLQRPHQRRERFKPIKLQHTHLADLTRTSPKKGDWVGKETLKDQHTASPQTVEHSHSQRGHPCAPTPKKQCTTII